MKTYKNIILYFIALVGPMVTFVSCDNEFLDSVQPKDQISPEVAFSDKGSIQLLVNGLYYRFGSFSGNGPGTDLTLRTLESLSDESKYKPYSSDGESEAYNSADYVPSYYYINTLWTGAYELIYHANIILEGLPNATAALTDANRNEFKAQALFFRGLSYFFLANLFGDVPLVVSTDYANNSLTPRAPKTDVYAQALSDVSAAQDLLPAIIPSNSCIYTSKYQIEAYQSYIYLTLGQWENAERAATDVITNGGFSLPALSEIFKRGSSEAILSIGSTTSYYPNVATYGLYFFYYNPSVSSWLSPSDSLIHAYSSSDPRLDAWLPVVDASVGQIRTVQKYTTSVFSASPTAENAEDNIYIRLAEVYLIRAEARAQQGNTVTAIADINEIRNRAGATPIPTTIIYTKEQTLKFVETERVLELCFEGRRWFDLVRRGTADQVYSNLKNNYKTGWASYKVLLPIPSDQIKVNPNLIQNNGYEKN